MNITVSKKKGSFFSFPFFTFIIFLFTVSCNDQKDESIQLLYNTKYKLVTQEEEVPKNDFYFEEFTTVKDSLKIENIALYKVIKHSNYTTYICIPTDDIPAENMEYRKELTLGELKVNVQSYQTNSDKLFYAIYTSLDENFKSFSTQQIKSRFENK